MDFVFWSHIFHVLKQLKSRNLISYIATQNQLCTLGEMKPEVPLR